jgi:hypothetical protein
VTFLLHAHKGSGLEPILSVRNSISYEQAQGLQQPGAQLCSKCAYVTDKIHTPRGGDTAHTAVGAHAHIHENRHLHISHTRRGGTHDAPTSKFNCITGKWLGPLATTSQAKPHQHGQTWGPRAPKSNSHQDTRNRKRGSRHNP